MKLYNSKNKIRFIAATALFDGHDASINIIRRILQDSGSEVIYLGHNRSAQEIVKAAIEEDVQGIVVSSYQGGHVEFFSYMVELLKKKNVSCIKIFGGGGSVITPSEIKFLQGIGIERIFSSDDSLKLGLIGMINEILKTCDFSPKGDFEDLNSSLGIARAISMTELGLSPIKKTLKKAPIIGVTGTGGAGKSSLIDELLIRYLMCFENKSVAVLSIDPSKRKTGGSLLCDRIRINSSKNDRVFIRSMATRQSNSAISKAAKEAINVLQLSGFDLIILETAGIGQGNSEVVELADVSLYVMTSEYGASSQLEKIDMLDYADIVAVNKCDKLGSLDAIKDIEKMYQRSKNSFKKEPKRIPVIGTCAHKFNDNGVTILFEKLMSLISFNPDKDISYSSANTPSLSLIGGECLKNISNTVRKYKKDILFQAEVANKIQAYEAVIENEKPKDFLFLRESLETLRKSNNSDMLKIVEKYNAFVASSLNNNINEEESNKTNLTFYSKSLSGTIIPRISSQRAPSQGEKIIFCGFENFPGSFPFTAGVFPLKRKEEDPTRMFAGEGIPEKTNARFHYLKSGQKSTRLSTAFDSVTLYGADPDIRPDIFGKIGNSGVSVCSLDDVKRLYSGFDLCASHTSVSMTINGPAPIMLAFFFNAAIDSACERELRKIGRWNSTEKKINTFFKEKNITRPIYRASSLPDGHDEMGLGFLGISSDLVVEKSFYDNVKKNVFDSIRGTIQADILKEEQAQNTCIFSIEFAMKLMGDVQRYFIDNNVRNFYSVSVSGYHIAEAGANPVTQLAFTLANGFTLVEYYKSRGMNVDDFASNFSFFFSNGLDIEYNVIGRVARRIWAIAMKYLYGASERSQKLKYHIQTSGRSLHAKEINFNDIRTTLQALSAIFDNCNSLHTNSYDEAITTPTEESVRRALAIQLIINRELGIVANENPLQGSYLIEYLTNNIEDAVLREFDSLAERGGVIGSMEKMYQRNKIQEESMLYEKKKLSGEIEIIGVNTFLNKNQDNAPLESITRSSLEDKNYQVKQVKNIKERFADEGSLSINFLKKAAVSGENIFSQLMECTKYCTLGDITKALHDVGGSYRRSI